MIFNGNMLGINQKKVFSLSLNINKRQSQMTKST